MPSSYQVVLWKQECFLVLRPLPIEFFRNLLEGVVRKAAEYRGDSRDPRGLVVFPLASRIDGTNSDLREAWWHGGRVAEEEITGYQETFEKLFSELYGLDECHLHDYFDSTQVPYDAHYAFGERIAARSRLGTSDKLSIGGACASLTRRLVQLSAPWEVLDSAELAAEGKRKAEEAALVAKRQVTLWKRALTVASSALLLVTVGYFLWQSWIHYTASGRRYQIKQDGNKITIAVRIFVTFEGPWAFVPDPKDANSILALAPKTKSHRDLYIAASNSAVLPSGIYDLSVPARTGVAAGAFDPRFLRARIDPQVVQRVLDDKASDRYAIRLPKPDAYLAATLYRSRVSVTYPPDPSTEKEYASGASLRYSVSTLTGFSLAGTPDTGAFNPLLLQVDLPTILFAIEPAHDADPADKCDTHSRQAFHDLAALLTLTLYVDFPDTPSDCHAKDPQALRHKAEFYPPSRLQQMKFAMQESLGGAQYPLASYLFFSRPRSGCRAPVIGSE